MPIYDYICGSCGQRTEVMHGVHANGLQACPTCGGGPMRKALHPPAIHFKGSGWAKKERAAGASAPKREQGAQPTDKPAAEAGPSSPPAGPPGKTAAPAQPAPATKPGPVPAKATEA